MQITIQIIGIVFTILCGSLLHFVYGWSGGCTALAFIAPVNESVFEHLKLLFTPYLLWTIVEIGRFGAPVKEIVPAKAFSVLAGMLIIVVGFYLYTAICGHHFLWADIGLFVLAVCCSFLLDGWLRIQDFEQSPVFAVSGSLLLVALAVCTVIFTFWPPKAGMFVSEV